MRTWHSILVLGFAATTLACAPPPEQIHLSQGATPNGPGHVDTNLGLEKGRWGQDFAISWQERTTPAEVFQLTENLRSLRITHEDPELLKRLEKFQRDLHASIPRTRSTLANSAYAESLVEESQAVAKETLDDLLNALSSDRKKIRQHLQNTDLTLDTKSPPKLESAIEKARQYVESFEKQIPRMGLHSTLARKLKKEIAVERERLIPSAQQALRDFVGQKTIHGRLAVIRKLLKEHRQNLSPADEREAKKAEALSREIESFKGPEGALKLLVNVWRMMSPADRDRLFKPASPELYDYLRGQDAKDLTCLEDPSCHNLFVSLAKTFVIYPQLNSYGLEKLRAELRAQGLQMLTEKARSSVATLLKGLPDLIETSIFEKLDPEIARLKSFRHDFLGGIKERLDRWTVENLGLRKDTVFTMTPSMADVRLSEKGLQVSWKADPLQSSLELSGALASWTHRLWADRLLERPHEISTALSQVEHVSRLYRSDKTSADTNLSARAQAESIRGLSRLITSFRDWGDSDLERILGGHTAQELFPEIRVDDLDIQLFPSQALVALAVSGVADRLASITADGSTVFMVNLERQASWADRHDFEAAEPSVMAGIVDRLNGERSPLVRSEDVARYILALTEFMRATEDLHKTKSAFLTKLDPKRGKIPLEELAEGRAQIRLLILAMSNYLSNQFRAENNLIHRELELQTQSPRGGDFRLLDQVLSIRALLEASEALGIEVYRWEAMDLYFAMNRTMFRQGTGFYGARDEMTLPLIAETSRSLELLEDVLPELAGEQLRRLRLFWSEKLRVLPLKFQEAPL